MVETYTTHAYGASPGNKFERFAVKRAVCGDDDIEFDVLYCGLCHSDIHAVDGDVGNPNKVYPLAPGHELSGVVTKVGKNVKDIVVGETVGVGCMVAACRDCKQCARGNENYCLKGCIGTYGDPPKYGVYSENDCTQGGYTEKFTVNRHFAFKVPKEYPLEKAGPLMCSAITLYTPLKKYGALKGDKKIGIIGVGGLGVMGLKIAKALGNEVWAISKSEAKREFAMALGIDGFIARDNADQCKEHVDSFDILINTVSIKTPTHDLMAMCAPGTAVVVLGLIVEPLEVSCLAALKEKGVIGSLIGGCPDTQEVINLCHEKKIYPVTELITADKIDECYDKLRRGNDRGIRYVLDLKASTDVKMN